MKTDDELNALFAEHVAGWKRDEHGTWINDEGDSYDIEGWRISPRFTTDANAVLPWLEKWADETVNLRDVRIYRRLAGDWDVVLRTRKAQWDDWTEPFAEADTFPRAAVITLLRAKGVEV